MDEQTYIDLVNLVQCYQYEIDNLMNENIDENDQIIYTNKKVICKLNLENKYMVILGVNREIFNELGQILTKIK